MHVYMYNMNITNICIRISMYINIHIYTCARRPASSSSSRPPRPAAPALRVVLRMRLRMPTDLPPCMLDALSHLRQHTCQHTSAHVSILWCLTLCRAPAGSVLLLRQHMSAYVSIRQYTSALLLKGIQQTFSTCTHIYACMYIYIFVYTYTYTHTQISIYLYMHTYVHVRAHNL